MTHRYGPHRTEDAPTTVLVGANSNEHPEPLHPALIAQRERVNNIAAGLSTKATVLAAVNAAADPDVAARIDAAILACARRGGVFSSNDVRPLIPDIGGGIVGARFNAAAQRGLVKRVGYTASTKTNTHGHPVAEWTAAA